MWLPLAQTGSNIGNESVVYISPIIWTEPDPGVACVPPCILVLPPSTLTTATTITFPPYVTSLEVGWITTVVIAGSTSSSFTGFVTTTTLSIPPVTTSVIQFWNVNVTSGKNSFTIYPTSSIVPPPFIITDKYPAGVTNAPETRTITPPPWPYTAPSITAGSNTASIVVIDGSTIFIGANPTTITQPNGVVETVGPSGISISGSLIPYPPVGSTITAAGLTIGNPTPTAIAGPSNTLVIDSDTIAAGAVPTLTITESGGQVVVIESSILIINGKTLSSFPTGPTTTDGVTILPPLPIFTVFPTQTIQPYASDVPTPTQVIVNGKPEPVIPCTAWFFFVSTDI